MTGLLAVRPPAVVVDILTACLLTIIGGWVPRVVLSHRG